MTFLKPDLPRWLVTRQKRVRKPSIAERINREVLETAKAAKVRGINLPFVSNREEARARLVGKGPFQHFPAPSHPDRTRTPGRSRRKRNAARERTRE